MLPTIRHNGSCGSKEVCFADYIKTVHLSKDTGRIVASIAAVSARRLGMADLGQSNLAVQPGEYPKLRFLDFGLWYEP